jgi:glycosyltransferase involved in cell wall biosynthesis
VVRILLWHGYFLRGTGSNVYVANAARTWRRAGHDVLLLCQETQVDGLGFVDLHGDFTPDNKRFHVVPAPSRHAYGRCRLARPHIGEVLPVYVYDEHPGFTAKLLVDLTDHELRAYTSANIEAMATAIEEHRPAAIITGHEVMGPFIALRACSRTGTGYTALLHGSGLEYAVKLQDRYRRYAIEGLAAADVVVGGSRYIVDEASRWIPGFLDRAEVVNPGCDVDLFRPGSGPGPGPPTVGYVGKLLAAKGVHHLLAALGLTSIPGLRAVIVGTGRFEGQLRTLAEGFRSGDLDGVRSLAQRGDGQPLDQLIRFLSLPPAAEEDYWRRAAQVGVRFTGELEHEPLAELLRAFDVLVVPSVVPEAFGLVAAEAAASGVVPIVANHSGLGEAAAAVEDALGTPGLLTFDPLEPVTGIADAVERVLRLPVQDRRAMGLAAARLARERWSWERVAERVLSLASAR